MPWFFPSFLTPTFLVLGVLAISLPILFHFFRRTPKGNVQFSSLMFLHPSPPRLTRRSRVDNWLLLILRGLVLLFIALAFGRIFFRQTDFLNLSDLPSRRVAILVDTSASMFRSDLWDQARKEYSNVLDGMGPNDEIGLFTFDNELNVVSGFNSRETNNGLAKIDLLRGALDQVSPRWRTTDLGQVLIDAIDALQRDRDEDSEDQITESQIILITDFQAGSRIDSLRSFEWPEGIPLEIKQVGSDFSNNATLSLADDTKGISADTTMRVKVTNVEESRKTQFELSWMGKGAEKESPAATVVVPPGQSRTVTLKSPDFEIEGLELSGDGDDFDNRYYLAFPKLVPKDVVFVGNNEDVRNQLRFYLQKACTPLIGKRFEFPARTNWKNPDSETEAGFVFVTGPLDPEEATSINQWAQQGGQVCIVVTDADMQDTVKKLIGRDASISKPDDVDYALLSEIDFDHKLFAPFADPKYSNFSNIRFWKHRKLEIEGLQSIAKFDSGSTAIGSLPIGNGRCYLLASGWHPADSQFGLSTKFVGVMMSMMLKKLTRENRNLTLGEPVTLANFISEDNVTLIKPDGNQVELNELSRPRLINEVDVPGIYQLSSNAQTKRVAFNLPASESRTDRLSIELLEQENVKLGTMSTAAEKVEKERQRKDTELESRQKLWRWMLILALVTVFAETFLSSVFAKRQSQADVDNRDSE